MKFTLRVSAGDIYVINAQFSFLQFEELRTIDLNKLYDKGDPSEKLTYLG